MGLIGTIIAGMLGMGPGIEKEIWPSVGMLVHCTPTRNGSPEAGPVMLVVRDHVGPRPATFISFPQPRFGWIRMKFARSSKVANGGRFWIGFCGGLDTGGFSIQLTQQ